MASKALRFVWLLCLASALPAEGAARNIVLFIADDHGCDAGCYGNADVSTPAIDALAAAGVVFDRAYCSAASCSSSRATILTGLHAHTNGQYGLGHLHHGFRGHAAVTSLPQRLARAGYRTARSGKLHVYPEAVYRFDKVFQAGHRDPTGLVRACRDFVASPSDRPFFLYIATYDPHRGLVDDETTPLRPNLFGNEQAPKPESEAVYRPESINPPPFLPDTPECRAELAEYYQSVSRVDRGVGELLQLLRETGRWEDTLVLYLSDHGIAMHGAKTTLYEPGMRSPLVVRDPYASRRGWRADALVSWADVAPTVLDFAGVEGAPPPPDTAGDADAWAPSAARDLAAHGRSFLPLLRDDPGYEPSEAVYGSHSFHQVTNYYPMRAMVKQRYKLIWNLAHELEFPSAGDLESSSTWQAQLVGGPDTPYGVRTVGEYLHRPEWELYDLQSDPLEANNLAEDPAHAATLDRLREQLFEFQRATDDPWLVEQSRD